MIVAGIALLPAACGFFLRKKKSGLRRFIIGWHLASLALVLLTAFVLFPGIRWRGSCTNAFIGLSFLASGITLFGWTRYIAVRVYSIVIALPVIMSALSCMTGYLPLSFPAMISYPVFAPPAQTIVINDTYRLQIDRSVLLSPTLFYISRPVALVLEQRTRLHTHMPYLQVDSIAVTAFREGNYVACSIKGVRMQPGIFADTLRYR
jgi:hypothetical protein